MTHSKNIPVKILIAFLVYLTAIIVTASSIKDGIALGVPDKFSQVGEKAGIAAGWHLDVKKKTVIMTLSKDCVSAPTSQKFSFAPTTNIAKGYFMSGGRLKGSKDDFIKLEPRGIYELCFWAKKSGPCKARASLLLFTDANWKSKSLRNKQNVIITSSKWKKYKYILEVPEKAKATIVHFSIEGKGGAVWLDDLVFKRISLDRQPVDGNPKQKYTLKRSAFIFPAKQKTKLIASKGYTIQRVDGTPTVCFNGVPFFAQLFFNGSWDYKKIQSKQAKDFMQAGINGTFLAAALNWGKEFASGGISHYGHPYLSLNRRIKKILEMNPKAKILLNVHLNVPRSWYYNHPDEILAADDGTPVFMGKRTSAAISRASKLCRQESGKRLKELINYIDSQKYSSSVMGFILFFGQSGEWNWFKPGKDVANRNKFVNLTTDHSPVSQKAFRNWLKKFYNNKITNLNLAWKTNFSNFSQAKVPKENELDSMIGPVFTDLRRYRKIYDYWCYYSEEKTKTLLYFAHAAKQATKINRLVGAYYGGAIYGTVGGSKNILRGGGGGFQRVLKSPDIDFLCNPNFYTIEQVGNHCPTQNLVDSIYLHGKFHFFEYDHPTSTGEFDPSKNCFAAHNKKRAPKNIKESIAIMKRDFSWAFCKNMGMWWWEMGRSTSAGSWFNAPAMTKALKQFQKIGQDALYENRRSISEIAVIYSLKSFRALKPQWGGIGRDLMVKQLDAFGKIGAPYDLYNLADLKRIRPYKLYIFWNTFLTNQEERKQINSILKKNNATALWIYAPGYASTDKGKSVETMEQLTGIKFAAEQTSGWPCITITNPFHPVSKAFYGKQVGLKKLLTPVFYVCDKKAIILGRSVLGGKPVFVIKNLLGWNSVYVGAYPVSPAIFRSIARYAGVHIYNNQDDALAVNESYFSIHSAVSGKRTITLPTKSDIYDLFEQKYIKKNARKFQINLTAPETRLFRITRL